MTGHRKLAIVCAFKDGICMSFGRRKIAASVCATLMIILAFQNVSADYNTGDDMDIFIDDIGNKNMVWRESVNGTYQVFYGYEVVDAIYNQESVSYFNQTINDNLNFDDGYLTIQNCVINGNIKTTRAQVLIEDCEINGNVKHKLGSLDIESSNINGNVDVENSDLELRTSYINGNVKTKTNTDETYSIIVTGNTVNGNVDLKSGICYVVGNTVNGNLKVKEPAIIQEVSDNNVTGNMQLTDNTSGFNGYQITDSTLDVMYPQVTIDASSGMGYVLWVINSSGTLEFWYTISPDMILWLEPKYGGILNYTAGNPQLDLEAANGTLYATWINEGSLTIAPDYNDPPILEVTGVSADRPVVHLNEPATISLTMSNTGNGSALYTVVNITDIVRDNETLVDTTEIGILRTGTETTYLFNWTPVQTGIHYLKVEMLSTHIEHHSPAALVESPPVIMSFGFPVAPQATISLSWGPGGPPIYDDYNEISDVYDPGGIREISGNSSDPIEITVYEGLTIKNTGTLILNEYVTFVIENPDYGVYGINVETGGKFFVNSPLRTTSIQPTFTASPPYSYPFQNWGTVDFLGANVTYTYGPSNLSLAGGIQNKPGSVCNLTDCRVEFADTYSVMAI